MKSTVNLPSILIVEDDPAVRELLRFVLCQHSFEVEEAPDAEVAQEMILAANPSLILLDWMLPNLSGIALAKKLKSSPVTQSIPIIMVTARGEEEDKVKGFECGADDYVTKPFSPRELVARIRAVLRRLAPHQSDEQIQVADLVLDPVSRDAKIKGELIPIGPTEFRLLHFFMTHPNRVYSRTQLLDRVWGIQSFVEERTVDVCVRRLRKALEPANKSPLIETIRGVGYRFVSSTT
ncbi:MAG: phosphate regulon transcriptional regulator PhoB [Betaproteobacteria bacterium]